MKEYFLHASSYCLNNFVLPRKVGENKIAFKTGLGETVASIRTQIGQRHMESTQNIFSSSGFLIVENLIFCLLLLFKILSFFLVIGFPNVQKLEPRKFKVKNERKEKLLVSIYNGRWSVHQPFLLQHSEKHRNLESKGFILLKAHSHQLPNIPGPWKFIFSREKFSHMHSLPLLNAGCWVSCTQTWGWPAKSLDLEQRGEELLGTVFPHSLLSSFQLYSTFHPFPHNSSYSCAVYFSFAIVDNSSNNLLNF